MSMKVEHTHHMPLMEKMALLGMFGPIGMLAAMAVIQDRDFADQKAKRKINEQRPMRAGERAMEGM